MELSDLLADAQMRADQDPYAVPLEKINVANPFLFARDTHHRWFKRLRDEAHRFAIGAHRARRAARTRATPLDEVPGVGAARKRALLAHFGSAKAVTRAGLADLRAAPGISDTLAETIHAFFHGER